ncbi:MAG: sigma factor-like helix-turn-helix DNA-binding protein [archaeon]|nr:sigma factor-like helix-turn-helix DNA-binding protein [archaeon]
MEILEQKIRELDIHGRKISEIATAAAYIFNKSYNSCRNILGAKRKGFDSYSEYREFLAKNKGHDSIYEETAKNAGFDDWSRYIKYLGLRKEQRRIRYSSNNQRRFEKSLVCLPEEKLDEISNSVKFNETAEANFLYRALNALSKREFHIISEVFLKGKTETEIGKQSKVTPQRIQIIKRRAMGKLAYFYSLSKFWD